MITVTLFEEKEETVDADQAKKDAEAGKLENLKDV